MWKEVKLQFVALARERPRLPLWGRWIRRRRRRRECRIDRKDTPPVKNQRFLPAPSKRGPRAASLPNCPTNTNLLHKQNDLALFRDLLHHAVLKPVCLAVEHRHAVLDQKIGAVHQTVKTLTFGIRKGHILIKPHSVQGIVLRLLVMGQNIQLCQEIDIVSLLLIVFCYLLFLFLYFLVMIERWWL